MAMKKAITIYVDEGCYIEAVCATWLVKREGSEENGVTMQNFWLKGNNAIYVPIKCPADTPVKAWKEDVTLPSAQPETAKRIVGKLRDGRPIWYQCDICNEPVDALDNYCCGCGRRLIDE